MSTTTTPTHHIPREREMNILVQKIRFTLTIIVTIDMLIN